MEFNEMTVEALEERRAQIIAEIDTDGADLDALEGEMRAIKEELENRKAAEAKRADIRSMVAQGSGDNVIKVAQEERTTMTNAEIRKSPEYTRAYAEYVKTENDGECRALLTENVSGSVPVPEFVEEIVRAAWDREGITSRVKKSYLKGNIKVGFEISGDDAVIHTEGAAAIDPENLVLGVVTLVPQSIKKVVQISDEVYDLRGEAFLRYIYDELTYRIAKKAADTLVAKIIACGTVSTTTCPGVPAITKNAIALGTVAEAMGHLSDKANNPVVIMNKQTIAAFKAEQYAASYPIDPFEGLEVIPNNSLKAFSAASTGDTYMIVGDLAEGAEMNFPNGDGISFKFDDMTLKKQDLIEVLGRQYVAIGVVSPDAFVKIKK